MLWVGHSGLKSSNPEERREAVEKMGQRGNTRAVEPLGQALQDEDRHVREAAAVALGKIGDFHATEALASALTRKDYVMVQARAAISLGKIGDSGGMRALVAALNRQIEHNPIEVGDPEDRILKGMLQIPQLDIQQETALSTFLQLTAVIALAQTQNSKAARMLISSLPQVKSDLLRYVIASSLKRYGLPIDIRKMEAELGTNLDEVAGRAEGRLGDVGTYAVKAFELMLVGDE